MRTWTLRRLVALLAFGASACDNSQAWHAPHLTLERMLDQRRGDPYGQSEAWADGRVMRAPPEDTFPAGPADPPHLVDAGFVDAIPYPITRTLLEQGRTSFETFCATCHGVVGDGHSVVAEKMELRPPPSLHIDRIRALRVGEIEDVIENGYGLMPPYRVELAEAKERWAVVAYVRALQLSQRADVATLPSDMQQRLAEVAP